MGTWLTDAEVRKFKRTASAKLVTGQRLKQWINFLVNNTFISFAGQVYKQTVGIPMGTNCAGLLANLYLYTFEFDFMERLIANNDMQMLNRFVHTCRYIDDVLAIDNPSFHAHLYQAAGRPGIYPQASLTLKLTSSGTACNYLDLNVTHNKRGWRTRIYDKRLEPKFSMIKFIRFPAIDSALSDTAKYGVVLSQLHRFSRLCSYKQDFVRETVSLLHALVLKGYDMSIMLHQVKNFLTQRPNVYASFSRSKLHRQIVSFLEYRLLRLSN